jgi:D-alanyl-D-alanine carboxypeptidase
MKKKITKRTRRKRSVIRNTILLMFLLTIALLAGIYGILMLRETKGLDASYAYERIVKPVDLTMDADMQRAKPFAADLCVINGNRNMDEINLTGSNEKATLLNLDDRQVMYAHNIHDRTYPASITKIMTAILAIKYGNMNDNVTISRNAVTLEAGSQLCGFQAGDIVTMDELFHGLLVYSGNDAAMAIAEHIGGSVDNFMKMMNEELRAIGATNTHFVNPHGLHDDEHFTTAYDIYLMLNEALKYEYFVDVMQLGVYNLSYRRADETITVKLDSTDRYLTGETAAPMGVTVLGGKTGTTSLAGACLAILSQNEYGKPYVSIVLGAPTKAILYQDMNQLLAQIN